MESNKIKGSCEGRPATPKLDIGPLIWARAILYDAMGRVGYPEAVSDLYDDIDQARGFLGDWIQEYQKEVPEACMGVRYSDLCKR